MTLARLSGRCGVVALACGWAFAPIALGRITTYHRDVVLPGYERALDIKETSDGGFITAGEQYAPPTLQNDWLVTRHAPDGTPLWRWSWGTPEQESATSVEEAFDGGFVVAGYYNGPGNNHIGLVKLSATGVVEWAYLYRGSAFDTIHGDADIVVKRVFDFPTQYLIVAFETTTNPQTFDPIQSGLVIGVRSDGTPVFQNRILDPLCTGYPRGLSFTDVEALTLARGVLPGLFYISGSYRKPLIGGGYSNDAMLAFLDGAGNPIWAKAYGKLPPPDSIEPDEWGVGLAIGQFNGLGAVAIAARTTGAFSQSGTHLFVSDLAGSPVWNGTCSEIEPGYASIKFDQLSNVVIAGYNIFGDGGRLSKLLSYTTDGTFRFLREYTGSFNTGFQALVIPSPVPPHSAYLPAGDLAEFQFIGNNPYLVATEASGRVGCEDALLQPFIDNPRVSVTDLALVAVPWPGYASWQATASLATVTQRVLCSPFCLADIDDGTMSGIPDGGVTIDDLLYYLFIFDQGFIQADVDDGTFTGTPDGGLTVDDLLYYLFRFDAGC